MTLGGGSIEVVRGHLSEARSEQILALWSANRVLEGKAARQRLAEVVCVALDDAGGLVGVNSAHAEEVAPVNRRFWRYRSYLPGAGQELATAMFNAAFEALGEGFDPDAPGPIGLAVVVTDRGEMETRPEAVWKGEELFYVLERNPQLRMNVWNYRTFVASPHRMSNLAAQLIIRNRGLRRSETRSRAGRGHRAFSSISRTTG